MRPQIGQQRQVTTEMQRVAEPVLMQRQNRGAGQGIAWPQRRQQAQAVNHQPLRQVKPGLVIHPRSLPVTHLQQGDRAVELEPSIGRRQRHRPVVCADRVMEPMLDLQRDAEVGPACRRVRIEPDGGPETLDRFRKAAAFGARETAQMVGSGCVRRGFQHRLRMVGLVVVEQELGEGQPQADIVGIAAQTGLELAHDQRARQRRTQFCEVEARMPRIRRQRHDPQQDRGRPVVLPHGGDGEPAQQQGVRIVRRLNQRGIGGRLGLLPGAGLQQPHCAYDQFRLAHASPSGRIPAGSVPLYG